MNMQPRWISYTWIVTIIVMASMAGLLQELITSFDDPTAVLVGGLLLQLVAMVTTVSI